MNKTKDNSLEVNRRSFIGNFSAAMAMLGGVAITHQNSGRAAEATSAEPAKERYAGPPVNCAVIGCGQWGGRELLDTLGRQKKANIVGVCDTYPAYLTRASKAAPKAEKYSDYKQVLANKDVQAVFIATPTPLHKQIAIEAMAAGKHVYCESPLAPTIEDAREIALAAKKYVKVNFQAGLQRRSDPEFINILNFVRAGAAGMPVYTRAQWNKKTSWRRSSPNPQREAELNWRLGADSLGLVGEVGINHIDSASWFLKKLPKAVTGFGSIMLWNDGREVADTINAIFEYRGGVRMGFESTLANSFDSDYDVFYGTDAAVMLRDRQGWMFKEVDSPILGWEVYARKESFFKEVGIVLAANATKLKAQGENPELAAQAATESSLHYALEAFLFNTDLVRTGVDDFTSNFGADDETALSEYLVDVLKNKMPAASHQDGFEANVMVVKANEAVRANKRVEIPADLYKLS